MASAGLWLPFLHGTFGEVTWRNSRGGSWGGQAAARGQDPSSPSKVGLAKTYKLVFHPIRQRLFAVEHHKNMMILDMCQLRSYNEPSQLFPPPIQEKRDEKYWLRAAMQVEGRKLNAGRRQWGEILFNLTISTSQMQDNQQREENMCFELTYHKSLIPLICTNAYEPRRRPQGMNLKTAFTFALAYPCSLRRRECHLLSSSTLVLENR